MRGDARSALMIGASYLIFGASGAVAQTTPAPTAQDDQVADIVVTAQRREESLQRVPVSVAAISASAIEQTGIRDLGDIAKIAPAVNIDSAVTLSGSSVASAVFIRGVGQSDFLLTTDPGVGLYLDGVYVARSVGSLLDVVDVSRIEVLRGPQGTLYGKNTIGGAINVVTERPKLGEFGGRIKGLIGSGDRFELTGSINAPLGQNAALRLTAARLTQDGYVDLLPSVQKLGNRNRWAFRAALAAEIGDDVSIDLTADYLSAREQGGATTLVGINPAGSQVLANARLGFTYDNRFLPATPYQAFGDPQVSNSDIWGVGATLQWRVNDDLTLKSITAYRGFTSFFTRDGDQSPLLLLSTQSRQKQSQYTQETQLIGNALGGRLDYLVGGFIGVENGQDLAKLNTRQVTVNIGGRDIDTVSWALFAQTTLDVTDQLSLTGGIRYTSDRKTYDPDIFIEAVTPGSGGPPPVVIGRPLVPRQFVSRTFNKTTFRLAAQYQFTPDVMGYVAYSTGFKSGGFVQRNSATVPALPSFGPETVSVFEGGMKIQAFDRRLRLNVAAFTNRYKDLQITVLQPTGLVNAPITQNAGNARINGAELDVEAVLGAGFSVQGGVAYLDAKYTQIAANAIGITLNSKLVRAPTWSGNIGLLNTTPIGEGKLTTRVDLSFSSRVFYETANLSPQSAYGVLNGTISYALPDDRMVFTVGGRSLTDKRYFVSADNKTAPGDIGFSIVTFARPREFFAQVGFRF